jgi:hypothetical protein
MLTVAAVLLARVHPAGRVMVTVWPPVTPVVGLQVPVNPDVKVTAGVAGIPNPASNVTLMVFPEARAPEAEDVKPTVQVEVAWAKKEAGMNVTPVGEVPITTGEAGLAGVVSWEVATLKVPAGYVPAPGLVIPAIVTVAAVLLARAQVPLRVMVTT